MRPQLLLIGGGGHCAACIDVIELEGKFQIGGVVDVNPDAGQMLGYPVLGGDDRLGELRAQYSHALITIGQIKSTSARIRLWERLESLGYVLPTIFSPRAYVAKSATVGAGTIVMHDALINANAKVGRNCIINTKALIEHDSVVGDNCHISTAAVINGGVVVGQGTFVGSNAVTKQYAKTRENDFIKAGALFTGYINE